jgi:hypothetical protein
VWGLGESMGMFLQCRSGLRTKRIGMESSLDFSPKCGAMVAGEGSDFGLKSKLLWGGAPKATRWKKA